jgi:2,5-diamino-6-(ribosylamino)-4(3H)-pyrimidinone 5'-phosphate reductase
VLDSDGKTPEHAHVLDGTAETLIATSSDCTREFDKAQVFRAGKDEVDLVAFLDYLSQRGVKRLLVEGGSTVIWSFLRQGLADELKVFVASAILGGHATPTLTGGPGVHSMTEAFRLKLEKAERLGDGILLEYAVVR